MKRTVLDIDGVFSHESLVPRPDVVFGGRFTSATYNNSGNDDDASFNQALTVVPQREPAKLDLNQIATGLSLNPDQIEELITGKTGQGSLQTQALADTVLVQLSPEDRQALQRISAE